MKSVLQDWVMNLQLRHQGVLLGAVRGCDTLPKYGHTKTVSRHLRAAFLNCFVGDPKLSVSFIEPIYGETESEKAQYMGDLSRRFFEEWDSLPHHYVMHLIHAIEVLGYYHPDPHERGYWDTFYGMACKKMHLPRETKSQLDDRLTSPEHIFKVQEETPY